MSGRNPGLLADPLFVGATRPPMRWGVTYSALLFNMVFTMEVFLLTKNLLTLLLCLPIHGVCMLLCARDARFFDLVLLWARTRLPALFAQSSGLEVRQLLPVDSGSAAAALPAAPGHSRGVHQAAGEIRRSRSLIGGLRAADAPLVSSERFPFLVHRWAQACRGTQNPPLGNRCHPRCSLVRRRREGCFRRDHVFRRNSADTVSPDERRICANSTISWI